MWVGLIQSVEGIKRKDKGLCAGRDSALQIATQILPEFPVFGFMTAMPTLAKISSLLACLVNFVSPHNPTAWVNSLKQISFFLSYIYTTYIYIMYIYVMFLCILLHMLHIYYNIHPSYWFYFSRELWLIPLL